MQFIEMVAYSPDRIDIQTHNSETANFSIRSILSKKKNKKTKKQKTECRRMGKIISI